MKLWEPEPASIERANITRFIEYLSKDENLTFSSFHEFRDWSAANPEPFWEAVADFCLINFTKGPDKILENPEAMPGARWFVGAKLNYAENVLRYSDERPAIIYWNESGRQLILSFAELKAEVLKVQSYLRHCGVAKGDVVAGYMPNMPETVICFLAAASLGAVWSSCSPDFSPKGVLDRFSQINPKVLVSSDGYIYKGAEISILKNLSEIVEGLSSLENILICRNLTSEHAVSGFSPDFYDDLPSVSGDLSFEVLDSDHPLFILYSSGTTGKPKCIVHGTAGILLEHVKEHALECNTNRQDIVFYNTTCGWMMWNWLVSALSQGAAILLYDGFAFEREGNIIFDMLKAEEATVFGTSAAFLQRAEALSLKPAKTHNLQSLRSILSTGSRLKPESFDYVYRDIKNTHLSPIWGGTDLCGCLGLGSVVLPVHRGEIQTRGLGLDVDVVDESGKSVRGIPGEVVVKRPFPSMPLRFLNDPGDERYRDAYFSHFPGMWRHGDLGIITENSGVVVLGRSDDTLNPGGVRIGASEITAVADSFPEVEESMAVGQSWMNDERILLFLIMKPGHELSQELKEKIIAAMPSPRHRPKLIFAVPDLPATINGKRSAKAVRDILNAREISNISAIANPKAIDFLEELAAREKLTG